MMISGTDTARMTKTSAAPVRPMIGRAIAASGSPLLSAYVKLNHPVMMNFCSVGETMPR